MRPPPSWLLSLTASLLLASSMVMAAPPPPLNPEILDGCESGDTNCVKPTVADLPASATGTIDRTVKCSKPGYALESTLVSPTDHILAHDAKIKAACYSKCHKKFLTNKCPIGMTAQECSKATVSATGDELSCQTTHQLLINGGEVTTTAKCDPVAGWKDTAGGVIFDFTADHHLSSFCKVKPLPTPAAQCSTSYADDCTGAGCVVPSYTQADGKLTCPAGSKLMYGSKLFDYVQCPDTISGWEGHNGADPREDFQVIPPLVLHVICYKFCGIDGDAVPHPTLKTLSCTSKVLEIDGSFYTNTAVKCEAKGWEATVNGQPKLLVDYAKNPFAMISTKCQPYDSLFENDCPAGVQECKNPPVIASSLLSCPANHHLIVDNEVYKELKVDAAGWSTTDATPKPVLKYAQDIKKLKARCLSRCHIRFVETCNQLPCTKPIYLMAGQPLFCSGQNEQLLLNGVEVPDVVCDDVMGGWKAAADTGATPALLVKFADYADKVTTECKKKPVPPTPAPPITNTTVAAPASKKDSSSSGASMYILIAIVVVLSLIIGALGLFLWRIHKKKSDSEEAESPSKKTTTKSNSKNNSSKNKKSKKGKKKNSDGKKGGKKGKNPKDTSKKGKKGSIDIDSNVEIPDLRSDANTIPLTAALGGMGSPPPNSPNAMDV